MTIDEDEFFENLSQLVLHYKEDADGLCTQLTKELTNGDTDKRHDVDLNAFREAGWVIDDGDIQVIMGWYLMFYSLQLTLQNRNVVHNFFLLTLVFGKNW